MTDISRSAASRQTDSRVSALVLAALRLRLKVEGEEKLPLEETKTEVNNGTGAEY